MHSLHVWCCIYHGMTYAAGYSGDKAYKERGRCAENAGPESGGPESAGPNLW